MRATGLDGLLNMPGSISSCEPKEVRINVAVRFQKLSLFAVSNWTRWKVVSFIVSSGEEQICIENRMK